MFCYSLSIDKRIAGRVVNEMTAFAIVYISGFCLRVSQTIKLIDCDVVYIPDKHRCNLSAHARVLSLIEGKWRILKELCCFGFQEDKRCFFFSDCSLIILKRQQRVISFWRTRIISVNRLQTP